MYILTKEDTSGHNYLYNNSILNQHTLQWGNTLAHNGRVLVHRSPSTKPYLGGQTTITVVHLVTVHACMQ